MPQLSLYITDDNLEILRSRAKREGISMSKYANRLIERDAGNGGWPEGFWDLYGSIGEGSLAVPPDAPPSDDAEFEALFAKDGAR